MLLPDDGRLAGDLVFRVFNVFAERQQAKKLVSAWDATKRRYSESPPERSGKALGKFRGDAFEFQVAADGAVRAHQTADGSCPRPEALAAARAAPRNTSEKTGEKV